VLLGTLSADNEEIDFAARVLAVLRHVASVFPMRALNSVHRAPTSRGDVRPSRPATGPTGTRRVPHTSCYKNKTVTVKA